MFCVTDLMPCDCRSLSQLVEVGPVKAAAYPMARVASHMLERHGPGLQRAPSHMLECSKQDRNCATSSMAQVLERASRAMEASQHFEHAASVRLNSMDRGSARQLNSLDMAINQVLQGMGHSSPSIAKEPTKFPLSRAHPQGVNLQWRLLLQPATSRAGVSESDGMCCG
ncbi:TPA: hypothetical protein ACH3X3_002954 [Trebouxia sp. C0006]